MDIVNPPDLIGLYSDQGLVSLRTSIFGCKAVKVVLNIVGGVKERVQSRGPVKCKIKKTVPHFW